MLRFLQKLWSRGSNLDTGGRGERLAADWLAGERRFVIVTRNWRNPRDRREEIDLVCRDAGVLVFVEVKARAAGARVPGYHAVDRRKKRVLRRAIETYLAQLREKPVTFRFDVVEVSFPAISNADDPAAPERAASPGQPEVLHFENVPLFSKHFRG